MIRSRTSFKGARAAGANWWEAGGATGAVAVYQPKGAASLAASYVNLANPGTFNAAPGVAPTWNATDGWVFNGSTQYLTTGVTPTVNYSILVRFVGLGIVSGSIITGCGPGAAANGTLGFAPVYGSITRFCNGGRVGGDAQYTDNTLAIAGASAYVDGAFSKTIPSAALNAAAIYIGATNNAGTPELFASCNIQALAIYNNTLDASEVAAVSAAMAAL